MTLRGDGGDEDFAIQILLESVEHCSRFSRCCIHKDVTFDDDGLKILLCAYHLKSNECGFNTFSHYTCGLSCRKWLVCRTNLLSAYYLKCGLNTYLLYTCGLPCRRWLVCRKILLCSYLMLFRSMMGEGRLPQVMGSDLILIQVKFLRWRCKL